MPNDTEIKKAFYEYGRYLARNMGEGVDPDEDAVEEAWDEVCDTSMMYSESLEHVLEKLEAGLGARYEELKDSLKLHAECERGWTDVLMGR